MVTGATQEVLGFDQTHALRRLSSCSKPSTSRPCLRKALQPFSLCHRPHLDEQLDSGIVPAVLRQAPLREERLDQLLALGQSLGPLRYIARRHEPARQRAVVGVHCCAGSAQVCVVVEINKQKLRWASSNVQAARRVSHRPRTAEQLQAPQNFLTVILLAPAMAADCWASSRACMPVLATDWQLNACRCNWTRALTCQVQPHTEQQAMPKSHVNDDKQQL